jgi:hypothetical protein
MRLSLLALLASSLSASACWWNHGPPVYFYPPPPPVYFYWVPPPVCVCPPPMMAPPQVVPNKPPERMPEKKTAAPKDVPFSPIVPATSTTPTEEKTESKIPKMEVPVTPPKAMEQPKVEVLPPPKVEVKPELPKIEMPKPEVKVELPAMPPVKETKPELPKIEMPSTTPKIELPPINAPAPALELPPLAIPPVKVEKSTSKKLTQDVQLRSVAGAAPADGRYAISFQNYSDAAIVLAVNGETLTLPAKCNVIATVSRSFTWSAGDGKPQQHTFAADAAGGEVVIR